MNITVLKSDARFQFNLMVEQCGYPEYRNQGATLLRSLEQMVTQIVSNSCDEYHCVIDLSLQIHFIYGRTDAQVSEMLDTNNTLGWFSISKQDKEYFKQQLDAGKFNKI